MGADFSTFLRLGFEHISDLKGYDHILFIAALCAVYSFRAWKQLLWLVTGFTVGHSITLALSTLRLVTIKTELVEFLIPVTILLTCIANMFNRTKSDIETHDYLKYSSAIFFGMIHGLGFSNFLRSMLGAEENLFLPLLAFNIGLELGQVFIVCIVMLISFLVVDKLNAAQREWNLAISGAIAGIAFMLVIERFIF
ncbi:MAG: HupE / UreJ protein [[Candidatus Thermochlorobacteriaceae] bacterium GBChlB]|nr:MAG: HupE / UreJ protein [[Candidatus Thermochlorobacteriaceae] bacterium GBChlB]